MAPDAGHAVGGGQGLVGASWRVQQTVLVFCSVVKMAGLLQAFADAVLAPFAAPHEVSHTCAFGCARGCPFCARGWEH